MVRRWGKCGMMAGSTVGQLWLLGTLSIQGVQPPLDLGRWPSSLH